MVTTRTDTMESGRVEEYEMAGPARQATEAPANPDVPERTLERLVWHLRGHRPDPTNVVPPIVNDYIAYCQSVGNVQLAERLKSQLELFESLTLAHELRLHFFLAEYHFDGQRTFKPSPIKSFKKLAERLEKPVSPRLSSVCVSFQTQIGCLGFYRSNLGLVNRDEKLASIQSMAYAMVAQRWDIHPNDFNALEGDFEAADIYNVQEIRLPSLGSNRPAAISGRVKPLWKSQPPPEYESDWKWFLSSPHFRPPPTDGISVWYEDQNIDSNHKYRRWVLGLNKKGSWAHLLESLFVSIPPAYSRKKKFGAIRKLFGKEPGVLTSPSVDRWPPQESFIDANFPFRAALNAVLHSSAANLQLLRRRLNDQQYSGRQSPSYSRLDYILHLTDHLKQIESNITTASEHLLQGEGDSQRPFNETKGIIEQDIDYLSAIIKELAQQAIQTEKMLRNQMEALSSYWASMLTIIGAVYIPLSLTTGIYGMNILEIGNNPPRWWAVVATGLPLVAFTVLVPLTYDRVIRLVLRAYHSRACRAIGIAFISVVYLVLFVSAYIPDLRNVHLNLIPTVLLCLYGLRKIYTTIFTDHFGRGRDLIFYTFFSVYVVVVGVLHSVYASWYTLPFFALGLPILWFWWHEERLEIWWGFRKTKKTETLQGS